MYGEPAKMFKIKKICDHYKIKIIEDAAPAIGAKINNKCGTFEILLLLVFKEQNY